MEKVAAQTTYANTVVIRATKNELVFEFGSRFPNKAGQPLTDDDAYSPDVRVVLMKSIIPTLIKMLGKVPMDEPK